MEKKVFDINGLNLIFAQTEDNLLFSGIDTDDAPLLHKGALTAPFMVGVQGKYYGGSTMNTISYSQLANGSKLKEIEETSDTLKLVYTCTGAPLEVTILFEKAKTLYTGGSGCIDQRYQIFKGGIAPEGIHIVIEYHRTFALPSIDRLYLFTAVLGELLHCFIKAALTAADGCGLCSIAFVLLQGNIKHAITLPGSIQQHEKATLLLLRGIAVACFNMPAGGGLQLCKINLIGLDILCHNHRQMPAGAVSACLLQMEVCRMGVGAGIVDTQFRRTGFAPLTLAAPGIIAVVDI